jgi:hypothetical protein
MAILLIAVDPGVNGGIAYVTSSDPDVISVCKMPESDAGVCELLVELSRKAKVVEMFLEEPPLFAGKNIPGSAIGKLMWNTGVLYGAAVTIGFRVRRVRPAIWMKALGLGTKGDLTSTAWKNKLKGRAIELYPTVDVTLWNADALLVLEYARMGNHTPSA